MGKREKLLLQCALFEGISEEELSRLLPCLRPKTAVLDPGEPLLPRGEPMTQIVILLSGTARVVDDTGAVTEELSAGDSWGEVFACAGAELASSVTAGEGCEVLRIDCRRALATCDHSCKYHKRLMKNLVRRVAEQALAWQAKLHILSQRTTQDKLMAYLRAQAKAQGSDEFTIPLDRQGLADYLGVERSAMSAEIGKLCKAGRIETKKSWFKML